MAQRAKDPVQEKIILRATRRAKRGPLERPLARSSGRPLSSDPAGRKQHHEPSQGQGGGIFFWSSSPNLGAAAPEFSFFSEFVRKKFLFHEKPTGVSDAHDA